MVEYIYKRSGLKIREMAFSSILDVGKCNVDATYLHSCDEENLLPKSKWNVVEKQYTLYNNLTDDEEQLLSSIKKNCRYEIRRAEKENVEFHIYDAMNLSSDTTLLDSFQKTYNEMFMAKGMKNKLNMSLIKAGISCEEIIITTATIPTDETLVVYHAYLTDRNNTMLIYSASPLWGDGEKDKANLIGRMNKYLHWKDMRYFKGLGCKKYEWGGITSPESPNGIDRFKMEFGGEITAFYNYIIGKTLLGKIYCYLINKRKKQNLDRF